MPLCYVSKSQTVLGQQHVTENLIKDQILENILYMFNSQREYVYIKNKAVKGYPSSGLNYKIQKVFFYVCNYVRVLNL